MAIANYDIKRILVNNRSYANPLFYNAFHKIRLPFDQLKQFNTMLFGFSEDSVMVEGEINLPVMSG